jgi:hypothetical protein
VAHIYAIETNQGNKTMRNQIKTMKRVYKEIAIARGEARIDWLLNNCDAKSYARLDALRSAGTSLSAAIDALQTIADATA